jgi:hypothetical protein
MQTIIAILKMYDRNCQKHALKFEMINCVYNQWLFYRWNKKLSYGAKNKMENLKYHTVRNNPVNHTVLPLSCNVKLSNSYHYMYI